ncbi:MAG: hypothetical protein ACI83Y_000846 [Candidatus Azotimanducaceae bacterium]|jgi:hypothetical protein
MQEFFSITASSYDAESLAPMLTEKSAEGWAVVSIVAAGTNIVAYLSRESGESDDVSVAASSVAAAAVAEMPADATTSDPAAASEVADAGSDPADAAAAGAEATEAYAAAVVEVADTPTLPGNDAAATAVAEPVAEPVAADQAVAATSEAAVEAAAESSVPAGWYADPSGRYELRYWDGSAWTEHVSRAGQQFTDPPVA